MSGFVSALRFNVEQKHTLNFQKIRLRRYKCEILDKSAETSAGSAKLSHFRAHFQRIGREGGSTATNLGF